MSKPLSSAGLHICQRRAPVPGGSAEERELDRNRTLHQQGPFLIKAELGRIRPEPAPNTLLNRFCQAIDVLLGRNDVFVDRRHPHA